MPFLPLHDTSSTRYKETKHSTVRFTSAGLPSLHNANPSTNGLHIHGIFFSHCSSSSALEVIMRKKPFHYCSVSSMKSLPILDHKKGCAPNLQLMKSMGESQQCSHIIKLPPKGWYLAFVTLFQWRIWNEFSSF